MEIAMASEAFANAHASDPSAEYVGGRYGYLHGAPMLPVPVRPGTRIEPTPGRLFPAKRGTTKHGSYEWTSAYPRHGIIATLRDENTGLLAQYVIETNSHNAVEVTGKL
ncbi:hypothetical protein QOU69_14490 [Burkholderia pseudomallei]|nr:hypothetical protein [Burkholderia pseudomallei]MDK2567922.1 hypothetical protein [Burkholderia pseudomallei]